MLEEKDLQVLKSMMETVINARASKTETLLLQMIDQQLFPGGNLPNGEELPEAVCGPLFPVRP